MSLKHTCAFSLSVSPASLDPNQDGLLTLQCTLWTYRDLHYGVYGLRWMDQNRTILSGHNYSQTYCMSNLTVERQSQYNRTYTCVFVDLSNTPQVYTDYRLQVGRKEESVPPGDPDCSRSQHDLCNDKLHKIPRQKSGDGERISDILCSEFQGNRMGPRPQRHLQQRQGHDIRMKAKTSTLLKGLTLLINSAVND